MRDRRSNRVKYAAWAVMAAALAVSALGLGAPVAAGEATAQGAPVVLAVAEFTGADDATRKAVAEVIAADLAASQRVSLVAPDKLQAALDELKLPDARLSDAAAAASVGKKVGAAQVVIGSFITLGKNVVLTARLVNAETGEVKASAGPEAEGRVEGEATDLMGLTHQLATRVHYTLTGEWLPLRPSGLASGPDQEFWRMVEGADAPFKVEVKVDRGDGATYLWGHTISMSFRVDRPAYVYLFNVNTARQVKLLYPNRWRPEAQARAGQWVDVPGKDEGWEMPIEGEMGEEEIIAVASTQRLGYGAAPVAGTGKGFIDFVSKGFIDFISKDVGLRARLAPGTVAAARVRFFTRKP